MIWKVLDELEPLFALALWLVIAPAALGVLFGAVILDVVRSMR